MATVKCRRSADSGSSLYFEGLKVQLNASDYRRSGTTVCSGAAGNLRVCEGIVQKTSESLGIWMQHHANMAAAAET